MNLVGLISTAVLSLTLVAAAPIYAQEQHGQEEQKGKPEEKKAQPEKSARQEQKPAAQQEKNNRQEEKSAQQQQQHTQQARPEQQAQRASGNRGGRIPDDRFKANFGEQHRFRVSHADYDNHRFQYGGYWFGFVDPWPSDWLYTQDVFVVEINGVYYLCNPMYPGINITLSFAL
jgi:flagellar motor protein MotB